MELVPCTKEPGKTSHWLKEYEVNVEILCIRSEAIGCLHPWLEQ